MPKLKKGPSNSRRRHTNSKLGCTNCKRKKIRCDENLPECDNCYRGKKETCSYLSLSEKEINRIKLTHSLRDSQNKLLNQNYRLPTSSTKEVYQPKPSSDVLEFTFEHADLEIRIPSMTYPPISYNNLTINDFGNEFRVITDDDSGAEQGTPQTSDALPGAIASNATFNVRKAQIDKSNYYMSNFKFSIAGVIAGMVRENRIGLNGILLASVICFGRAIVFNHFNQKRKISALMGKKVDFKCLDLLERICLESHGFCFEKLEKETAELKALQSQDGMLDKCRADIMNLCISKIMLAGSSILLNFSAEKYRNIVKDAIHTLLPLNHDIIEATGCDICTGLEKSLKYNIASVSIPRYDPKFFTELLDNFKGIGYLFDPKHLRLEDEKLDEKFQRLCVYYKKLFSFMSDKVLVKLQQDRDGMADTSESMHFLFDLLKTWYSIFPDEAMVFMEKTNVSMTEGEEYLEDLKSVVFAYYHAVSASLEALFPSCRYVFQAGFIATSTEYHYRKIKLKSRKDNKYHNLFKKYVITQHHVFFAARLFAYFKRRYKFYKNHVKWVNLFANNFKMEDLSRRMVKNVQEVQITSFNTTLIRPEHYPTSIAVYTDSSHESDFTFSRKDDSLDRKLYARNIEKLDFFNQTCILQFDYDTMLLLRDYRPLEEVTPTIDKIKITPLDIHEYFADVAKVLSGSK